MSRTSDGAGKYRLFRNYMANELGVTREDIETWTKEAIQEEVCKLIGQLNLPVRADTLIRAAIQNEQSSFQPRLNESVLKEIAASISKQFSVKIEPRGGR